jgi:hypothetical protein
MDVGVGPGVHSVVRPAYCGLALIPLPMDHPRVIRQ